ncbi:hypothetical protein [Celeribacter sp.]|uniref:hypothetical protein n=1 Tax=Celeribacter sp. TaxID=1890673 RepID=UPI003A93B9BE
MRPFYVAAVVLAWPLSLPAQDAPAPPAPTPTLTIDLNAAEQTDTGCLVTFVADNKRPAGIAALVLETVLFDTSGQVTQMTMLDFATLPAHSTRVRQFNIAGQPCDGIGRVLFNGVQTCDGGDATPAQCAAALAVSTRTDIAVSQ